LGVIALNAGHDKTVGKPYSLSFPREERAHTLHGRFEQIVQVYGSRPAVHSPTVHWTYAQLNQRANGIAQALLARTPAKGTRIALLYPHDAAMVAAILGVLKAGGVYIPLDPLLPEERLVYMVRDAGAQLVLSDGHCREPSQLLARAADVDLIDTDALAAEGLGGKHNPDVGVEPNDYAYILYTSGSTGQPKGIIQTHRNLMHHIRVWTEVLAITCEDRMTLVSAFTWDSALQDLYGALLNGAESYVFDVREQGFERLAALMSDQRLTVCHFAVPVYRNVVQCLAGRNHQLQVRVMGLGADMVHQGDVESFRQWFPDDAYLVNAYGATESTTATIFRLGQQDPVPRYPLPIGRAVDATQVAVLDAQGQPIAGAGQGELAIISPYIACGYVNQPELTAEKFRPHAETLDLRIYLTGDLGERLADGHLVLLGRRDNQIKIRGMRVDLGDIEASLVQHSAVREAVVMGHPHPSGDKRLVAYVVSTTDRALDSADLRAFLGTKIPDYMIPSVFIALESLPLTPNGKVDRKVLPLPDWSLRTADTEYVAPRNSVEHALERAFSQALGLEYVGIHDHFLELGGDSLLALRVVLLAEQQGFRLRPRQIFSHPTVAELALIVEPTTDQAPGADATDAAMNDALSRWAALKDRLAEPDQVEEIYPLAPAQKGIYYQCLMAPKDSGIYLEQTRLTLVGALDTQIVFDTWSQLVARHAILRTTFQRRGLGQPHQVVWRAAPTPLRVEDWRWQTAEQQAQALAEEQDAEMRRGFVLDKLPLMRMVLIRTGKAEHQLLWTCHHIVLDGWSENLLLQDFFALYQALVHNAEPNLPVRAPYRDFIYWVHHRNSDEDVRFWREFLAGYQQPVRLGASPRDLSAAKSSQGFAQANTELERLPIVNACKLLRVPPSTFLQGAWALTLARASGATDLVYGSVVSGREQEVPGIADMVGLIVNTLPVRVKMNPELGLAAWLQELQHTLLEVRRHAATDLGDIERLSDVAADQRPLLDSVFIYLNLPSDDRDGKQLLQVTQRDFRSVPHFPLTLFVDPGQSFQIRAVYRPDRLDAARVEVLLEDFAAIVWGMVEHRQLPSTQSSGLN